MILKKPDILGASASSLCTIHCLVTPILFITHSCSVKGCATTPIWWQYLDYAFLFISFLAIISTTKNNQRKNIKKILWISWGLLAIAIINRKIGFLSVPQIIIYSIAMVLALTHLYNRKCCKKSKNNCSISHPPFE